MQSTLSKTILEPTQIAPETFLLHDHAGEGTAPVCVPINTMVIRAAEPVVVDTGAAEHETKFLADVFSVVEPDDVRWVFISHDDIDHTDYGDHADDVHVTDNVYHANSIHGSGNGRDSKTDGVSVVNGGYHHQKYRISHHHRHRSPNSGIVIDNSEYRVFDHGHV